MKYEEADKSFVVNDGDPDLRPIRLSLPRPPNIEEIDGYGLPPEEQRFKKIEIPIKLQQLERGVAETMNKKSESSGQFVITYYNISKEFWDTLNKEREYYKEEIEFIRKMWWHRLYGYWFFLKGKPTYITGWHFMYLNFWKMPDVKGGYPEYRDRDRREFLFHQYAYTTTETFARIDDRGWAIPEENGTYKMIDLGRRVCYGLGQPKNRRSGNTNKGLCIVMDIVTRIIGTDGGGIMSYTAANAEKHYRGKLIPAWDSYPMFFRPFSLSRTRPKTLIFDTPSNDLVNKGLGTAISWAETSSAKYYDGMKLMAVLCDEEGKTSRSETDVDERNRVIRNCLSQGGGYIIHGYSYHPSTVEEYEAGGQAYGEMMKQSSFYQRVKTTGQTPSGIFRIFISAEEGLDGNIDSYGYSVRGRIKDYQKKEGFTMTSDERLTGIKQHHLKQNTPESQAAYRSERKLFPQRWADCWLGEAGDIGFDMEKIDNQIIEIHRMIANGKNPTIRGNFIWMGNFGGDVDFEPDENGRYEVSDLARDRANKKIRDIIWDAIDQEEKEAWRPYDATWGTAGGDPFRFKKKAEVKFAYSKHAMSDGGFSVLREYDQRIDGTKPRSQWTTDTFVCTYRFRPKTDDEFCEDCLKACIWYGVQVYPEMNFEIIYKNFRNWGFGGYLKYDIMDDGHIKDEPGTRLYTQSKQEALSLMRNFINYRCQSIMHVDLLTECKLITNMDDLQHYDLLASAMCALLGSKSRYSKQIKQQEATVNVHGLFNLLGYRY